MSASPARHALRFARPFRGLGQILGGALADMSPISGGLRRQFQALRPAWRARVDPVKLHLLPLCAALLCGVAHAASAQPMPAAVPADALSHALALVAEAAQALAPAGARVLALPGPLDPRLKLAACERVQPQLPTGVPAWGRTRVALRCVQGPVAWNVHLPVTVQVWAPALVARTAMAAGSTVQPQTLGLAEIDWAAATAQPYADSAALAGRVLARPLAAGEAVRPPHLQARQWFAAGDVVSVVSRGRGFSIATEGQALAAGVEGRPVRVRINDRHVAVGRPVGPKLVEVGL